MLWVLIRSASLRRYQYFLAEIHKAMYEDSKFSSPRVVSLFEVYPIILSSTYIISVELVKLIVAKLFLFPKSFQR